MDLRVFSAIIFVLCIAVQVAAAFTDGLLPNGNFEAAPEPSQLKGSKVIGRDAIPQWRISGLVEYIKAGQKQGDMLLVVPEGHAAVRLGNEASITQRLAVVSGKRYSLTFTAARTCAADERLNVSVAPDSDVIPIQTVYSSNGWDSYAWAWTASSSVAAILLHNSGVADDPACGPVIDSVAVKALSSPRATVANMLKNGGFEEGPYVLPNTSSGVLLPPHIEDARSPLPGWVVESIKAVKYLDSDHFSVPAGRRAVELVGGRESAIAQMVRTVAGRRYALTFTVGDARNTCKDSMSVEAFAGKASVKVPYVSRGDGGSTRAALRFVADSNRTRVVFTSSFYHRRSDDMSSLCGPVIDDVALVSAARKLW